jgi:hypothetical protein
MSEIDALSDAALSLLALVRQSSQFEARQIRRRVRHIIELADRMEQNGGRIMSDQPSFRDAFGRPPN